MPPDHVRRLLAATLSNLHAHNPANANHVRLSKSGDSIAEFKPGREHGTMICSACLGSESVVCTLSVDGEGQTVGPSVPAVLYEGFPDPPCPPPMFAVGDVVRHRPSGHLVVIGEIRARLGSDMVWRYRIIPEVNSIMFAPEADEQHFDLVPA
jgi:hypothetical protein